MEKHLTKMSARQVAVAVLNQFKPQQTVIRDVLSKFLAHTDERAMANDLVLGVIRNMQLIDMLLLKIAGVTISRVEKKLKNVIRVGVYELVFTPDRADYAIVDAAVEHSKVIGGIKKTGFVNAVLRTIGRSIENRSIELTSTDPLRAIPQDSSHGCLFSKPILPDAAKSPADYLSSAFSLPSWLVDQWLQVFGFDDAKLVCIASNRRPGLYIRPNALKTTPQKLAAMLLHSNIACEVIEDYQVIKLTNPGPVDHLPGFADGLFIIQDLTASLPAKALAPAPGSTVLDLCSAPGGKTTGLAEIMNDSGTIIATDIDSVRLEKVKENQNRLGIKCIKTVEFSEIEKLNKEMGGFYCILLDVPCSNTGVMSRRPEVRFRISKKDVAEITRIQSGLLDTAAKYSRPGTKICYSTCSIQKQENSAVVDSFLKANPAFKCVTSKLTLPSASEPDCDGGYYAILVKQS